jgi:hypothetical protein
VSGVRRVRAVADPLPLWTALAGDAESVLMVNRGTASVFIGADASVTDRAGVQLPPLASLVTRADTDWWVIADPAAAAAGTEVDVIPQGLAYTAGAAEIATQIALAQAQLALLDLRFNTAVPFTGTPVDVSLYGSYILAVQYEAAFAAPPAATAIITLEWGDTITFNNLLYRQTVEINSINSADCGRSLCQDKMYGPFMRVSAAPGNLAASTVTLILYGSYRTFTGSMRCRELGPTDAVGASTDNTRVLFAGNIAGGGGTASLNVRLGSGQSGILSQIGTAAFGGGQVSMLLHSPALGVNARFWQRNYGAPNGQNLDIAVLPRRALTLQLTNTDATVKFAIISVVENEE